MADNLYQTLGVPKDASADAIRKAYRKLARKHHPDVNPNDKKAEDAFKKVSTAYEVLSDDKRRKAYDEFGDDSLHGNFDADKAREHANWQRTSHQRGPQFESGPGGFDFSDLYLNLSGGEYPNLQAARDAGAAVIAYGLFINVLIRFVIVAFAVFMIVKLVNRFQRKAGP